MITAIAIDDEPVALDVIRLHASKIPFLELKSTFTNAKAAFACVDNHQVDLIFLDISMPDISGLEMAAVFKDKAQIIFTTAYAEHALKGFDLAATDYLLKPINFSRFLQACELAKSRAPVTNKSMPEDENLFVKDGHDWLQIKLNNILYVQAQDNYVSIIERERRTLTRMTLTELQEKLPVKSFLRVHKSYLVALNKIDRVEKHQITIGDNMIPLSPVYKDGLLGLMT